MYVFADRCGEGGQKIAAASVDGFAAGGRKKKKKWAEGGVKGRKLTEEEAPVLKGKHAGIPAVCFCIWHLLAGF